MKFAAVLALVGSAAAFAPAAPSKVRSSCCCSCGHVACVCVCDLFRRSDKDSKPHKNVA